MELDTTGTYGGMKFSIKTSKGSLQGADVYYELRNLSFSTGWDNDVYGPQLDYKTLWVGMDNGLGKQRWVKVSWNLDNSGNWRIPPYGSFIVCDDLATFKSRFDPGDRTVYQMKNVFPEWFMGPKQNLRLRLTMMNNPPDLFNIYALPGDYIMLDDIDFNVANGGVAWQPYQALTRQNPLGTGFLAVENYSQPGLELPYGTAYVWIDLGAFVPPTLVNDIGASTQYIAVIDPDKYPAYGTIKIGLEDIQYGGKDGEYLIATVRGANGTTAAAHTAGDPVFPCYDANAGPGGTKQTGPIVSRFTIQRKEGVPPIQSGVLLYSNLAAPGDPSQGGAKWGDHPDWKVAFRWGGNTSPTLEYVPPLTAVRNGAANVIQARHWCVVAASMVYANGTPQRFKVNELIVPEWSPAGGVAGAYAGHGATEYGGMVGHLLTQHGGVPFAKYAVQVQSASLGDLHITPATVDSMIGSAIGGQYLGIYNDPYNTIALRALPGSPLFNAGPPMKVWTPDNTRGATLSGDWDEAHGCAQVILYAIDPQNLKQYVVRYPAVPDPLGDTLEVRDINVTGYQQAQDMAKSLYRNARTRRAITLPVGAVPWLRLYQRHVIQLDRLDLGGAWSGINMWVQDYTITIGLSDKGSVTWGTAITFRELAL